MLAFTDDLERARSALHAIPPDLPRDEWVRAGMAAQAAGLDFDAFNNWSAGAGNYNERDARDTWRSFKPGKGLGAGTLYRVAAEHGWRMSEPRTPQRAMQAPRKPAEPPRKPAPGMSPAEVWERCEAATTAHGYIEEKGAEGVPLSGLRVVPAGDALRIAGQSMAGALVVPALAADGTLQSLQLIPPPGARKKLNLPGAPMAGASFTVGETVPGGSVYVCEGIGAAWACWQATGAAAVVAFGWGNVARVAADLRQRDTSARLVLVPDAGKESEALRIAAEVGATVATMPQGEAQNFDANDLAQREGRDVLAALLEAAQEPPKPEQDEHPLAVFVDYDGEPRPSRFVIPGFIGDGLVIIAGHHGVGKTETLLPLALVAAGVHASDEPLAPRHWRHVVYITEDTGQAERILAGVVRYAGYRVDLDTVRKRLHLVQAVRLDAEFVAEVGTTYKAKFTRVVDGVEVLPLVVLDTKSAVLALDDENDNGEASKAMAALKQGFEGLPTWVIGHVAKAQGSRAESVSMRGAGAFEADANQVLYLVVDEKGRFLTRGKTRFVAKWQDLEIKWHKHDTTAQNEFGEWEPLTLSWSTVHPSEMSRKDAADVSKAEKAVKDEIDLRDEVMTTVGRAQDEGHPRNRAGIKSTVRRQNKAVHDCIEALLAERWLIEVEVPAKLRIATSKRAFIVRLSEAEHEAVKAGAPIPEHLLEVPQSWRKPELAPVPDPAQVEPELPDKEGEA